MPSSPSFDFVRTGDILLPVFGIVGLKRWEIDPGLEKSRTLSTSEIVKEQASVVLRKAVQIIVMSVTVVTLAVFIELLREAAYTLSRDRQVIVTVIVTEETP